jgi:cobalt-zinc-cadmium efflux system membrane fusion protein
MKRAIVVGVLLGLLACEAGPETTPKLLDEPGQRSGEPPVVRLEPETLAEFGIELGIAGPGRVERSVVLPAEVRPNQDRLAHIAPRFPGIVRAVRADIGDHVEAGQVLAIVESEALSPFPLKTLIDGVVIQKHITRGEPVSREQAAFVVADLRDVWIDISVYQKDLVDIAIGQPVRVSAGHGLQEAEGRIAYLSPVVDEATRTATARVVLANPDGLWRPGLFVTARIRTAETEVPVAVPRTALQELRGEAVIFVETGAGLVAQPVRIGRQGESRVEIVEGLTAGQRYVSHGGFTLKSELARGSFSGGHAH